MILLHCRLNFSTKNERQTNDRCHGIEIIYSPCNGYRYVINLLIIYMYALFYIYLLPLVV